MNVLNGLEPAALWGFFEEICRVPRPSGNEGKMVEFLMEFAGKHGIEARRDAAGNVVMRKGATRGREGAPAVVLQAHMDMVCESDGPHDFTREPIRPFVDGGWVKARGGTTLGADDGIGMAACMAVLTGEVKHGPLECLFTVDEERGLTGAMALEEGFVKGRLLLNLDSEDEGEMFIGCAGGIDTMARVPCRWEEVPGGMYAATVGVEGLLGGHSGDDIHKGRGNAIKLLARLLERAARECGARVATLEGGKMRNAIPREARAVVVCEEGARDRLATLVNVFAAEVEVAWKVTEPGARVTVESTGVPARALDGESTGRLVAALVGCPHGVLAMSFRMPGMVETSTNLAAVRLETGGEAVVTTSQRSDLASEKEGAAGMVAAVFRLAGARVEHGDGYPGWTPNPASALLEVVTRSYEQLFGKAPVVRSIHAGLECGLFLEKFPDMDMVSFGPTLRDVHSPGERVEIATVERWWRHLVNILECLR